MKSKELYNKEMEKGDEGWGPQGRMTTYAGAGVGSLKSVLSAEEIVKTTREQALTLEKGRLSDW
jgi:nitronate monooxygenase